VFFKNIENKSLGRNINSWSQGMISRDPQWPGQERRLLEQIKTSTSTWYQT
jgi:hypothetical protein